MAAQAAQLENVARDLVNVGIGLFHIISRRIETLQEEIVAGYSGLVTRGAADKSELAEKLRGGLGEGLTVVRTVGVRLGIEAPKPAVVVKTPAKKAK